MKASRALLTVLTASVFTIGLSIATLPKAQASGVSVHIGTGFKVGNNGYVSIGTTHYGHKSHYRHRGYYGSRGYYGHKRHKYRHHKFKRHYGYKHYRPYRHYKPHFYGHNHYRKYRGHHYGKHYYKRQDYRQYEQPQQADRHNHHFGQQKWQHWTSR